MIDTPYANDLISNIDNPLFANINAFGLYYFNHSGFKQRLTNHVALALSHRSRYVVSVWESGFPTSVEYFTADNGASDAASAITQATDAGQPLHTPIYATVDYDASQSDLHAIFAYFAAYQKTLKAAGYLAGVYGSGMVCSAVHDKGYVSFTWLSGSTGWSGFNVWKNFANIVQGASVSIGGIKVDADTTNGNAGGWQTKA